MQRILEIYRRTGRGLAQVTPRVVDLPNGRVDVVYTIVEGDKTGVQGDPVRRQQASRRAACAA